MAELTKALTTHFVRRMFACNSESGLHEIAREVQANFAADEPIRAHNARLLRVLFKSYEANLKQLRRR
jgi:hypothetical protein